LLLAVTVIAVGWANSPGADAYDSLRGAIFVAGLELKREFVLGELRDPRRALVPVAGAIGGVLVPALVYLAVTSGAGGDAARGWAIPAATDIAFAVAVLAVVGRSLPVALRIFLLTLAVVDDLIAITIIAVGYTDDLSAAPLLVAVVPLAGFALLAQRRITAWWALLPLALATWALVHASGVHATVAGVLLGLVVPAREVAERLEHVWRPWSVGLAVPVFALLSAGVALGGFAGMQNALTDTVALAIIAGLVVGKPVGILGAVWVSARLGGAELDRSMHWSDLAALASLAGIGFTVSLLVGELAFGPGSERDEHVKIGVLTASLVAALVGSALLRLRAWHRPSDIPGDRT
jgi:NhaA family Na+:H+ antiporter